ncbi:MAG: methionyl-tRNA formyltransferase [Treponema sp.]|jgi:methionyl-tRNA formyltransferase|nr:methionyl-tRNA formyltransferase [Treponema sp.]
MRILFAGSPAIAVPALEALVERELSGEDYTVAGIVTNPDSPRGRHGTPEPTAIGAAATALSEKLHPEGRPRIVQLKPPNRSALTGELVAPLQPDLLVSFAYGHIFSPQFLALFPRGGINIHPSLLPKYRGATPIPAAILGRDRETGITIQRLGLEMDTGDILIQERFPLNGRETTASLSDTAARKGATLLIKALQGLAQGTLTGSPQTGTATYCSRITKEDGPIDWSWSAAVIDARIRAFTPWPLAWTMHGEQYLYILEAMPLDEPEGARGGRAKAGTVLGTDKNRGILVQTGEGIVGITRLQYRAKKALEWRAFLNGARNFSNTVLGAPSLDSGSDAGSIEGLSI